MIIWLIFHITPFTAFTREKGRIKKNVYQKVCIVYYSYDTTFSDTFENVCFGLHKKCQVNIFLTGYLYLKMYKFVFVIVNGQSCILMIGSTL